MLAGFILGLSVGLFFAVFTFLIMDCKIHELRNQTARVFKQSTNKWRI